MSSSILPNMLDENSVKPISQNAEIFWEQNDFVFFLGVWLAAVSGCRSSVVVMLGVDVLLSYRGRSLCCHLTHCELLLLWQLLLSFVLPLISGSTFCLLWNIADRAETVTGRGVTPTPQQKNKCGFVPPEKQHIYVNELKTNNRKNISNCIRYHLKKPSVIKEHERLQTENATSLTWSCTALEGKLLHLRKNGNVTYNVDLTMAIWSGWAAGPAVQSRSKFQKKPQMLPHHHTQQQLTVLKIHDQPGPNYILFPFSKSWQIDVVITVTTVWILVNLWCTSERSIVFLYIVSSSYSSGREFCSFLWLWQRWMNKPNLMLYLDSLLFTGNVEKKHIPKHYCLLFATDFLKTL